MLLTTPLFSFHISIAEKQQIALRDGNNDNQLAAATSYVGVKPLMRGRTRFISHLVLLFDDDNTRQCEQLAIMRKRTSYPLAIVRKCTSY